MAVAAEYVLEDRGYSSPCWIWQRGKHGTGYGSKWERERGQAIHAHRHYYEQANGPIPDGLEIDHLCRTRACVNPSHLEAVTHAENIRRGNQAKLTKAQAREIRSLYAANEVKDRYARKVWSQRALARRYGVNQRVISLIVRGEYWRDV